MATIMSNPMIDGMSGKFGSVMVFRTMRGKTFVSHAPCKPDKTKESVAQRNTRSTFREAAEWAKQILQDPEKKMYYQQRAKALKLPNAYTTAITDYMRKPKVVKSQQGNTLHYRIHKDGFALKEVKAEAESTTLRMHQHKDNYFVEFKPDANTICSSLTFTIVDSAGRCNVVTSYS